MTDMGKFDLVTFLTLFFAGITAALPMLLYQRHNHKQNRAQIQTLIFLFGQYRLHEHTEWVNPQSTGPLFAQNMRFPKTNGAELLRGAGNPLDDML